MRTTEQLVGSGERDNRDMAVIEAPVRSRGWAAFFAGVSMLTVAGCTVHVEGQATSSPALMAAANQPERKAREAAPVLKDVCSLDKTAEDHQRMALLMRLKPEQLSPCSAANDGKVGNIITMGTWLTDNGTLYMVYTQKDSYGQDGSIFDDFSAGKDITPSTFMTSDDITFDLPWRFDATQGNAMVRIGSSDIGAYVKFPNEEASKLSGPKVLQDLVAEGIQELYVR